LKRAGALIVVLAFAVVAFAQQTSVRVEAGALHVRAPGFGFLKGTPLARLKNGRAVRFDFVLNLLGQPASDSLAETRQSCVVSYDLWEERFAVTVTTTPPRSISHLTTADAEVWCLDHLAVPLTINMTGRGDAPFWMRLSYTVVDDEPQAPSGDGGLSLRGLVDRLSQRRAARPLGDAFDAGPFRLPR
jgi:hypothetical protein